MKTVLIAVKDTKQGTFGAALWFRTIEAAIREFRHEAMNPDSMIGKYPEDHELWYVGKFDQETGIVTVEITGPLFLVSGVMAKGQESEK